MAKPLEINDIGSGNIMSTDIEIFETKKNEYNEKYAILCNDKEIKENIGRKEYCDSINIMKKREKSSYSPKELDNLLSSVSNIICDVEIIYKLYIFDKFYCANSFTESGSIKFSGKCDQKFKEKSFSEKNKTIKRKSLKLFLKYRLHDIESILYFPTFSKNMKKKNGLVCQDNFDANIENAEKNIKIEEVKSWMDSVHTKLLECKNVSGESVELKRNTIWKLDDSNKIYTNLKNKKLGVMFIGKNFPSDALTFLKLYEELYLS